MTSGFFPIFNGKMVVKSSFIPDYIMIQTFISRSRKKRIIKKCEKKYTKQVANEAIYLYGNDKIICTNLMYEKLKRGDLWKN